MNEQAKKRVESLVNEVVGGLVVEERYHFIDKKLISSVVEDVFSFIVEDNNIKLSLYGDRMS